MMNRKLRRYKQELSHDEIIKILSTATSGVLAVLGDDDYPYAVPLSYVYHQNQLIFHCACTGHKIDAIKKHQKVSFCIIDQDQVVPEKYTTYYRSVIVFGKARLVNDDYEKRRSLEILAAKYSPDDRQGREEEINKLFQQVMVMIVDIESISGKEAIELKNKE